MTLTAPAEVLDGPSPAAAPTTRVRAVILHALMAASLLWWGILLTYHGGGRDRWVLPIGLLLAVVAMVAARVWETFSARSLVLAASLAVIPVVLGLIDATHWYAGSQAAAYAYAVALFLAVRAYAVTTLRRTWIVGLVLATAVAQFAWGFVAWQSTGDPAARMIGRFFWYNQFAAFLLVPAVVGAGLAVIGKSPLRILGAVAAVLCSAGVVLSTSRATMALLAVGWLSVVVLAVGSADAVRSRLTRALGWLGLGAVTAGVTFLLPGPPFFDHRVSALAGTAARSVGQPVVQNGVYRLDFWRQSLQIFSHHPLAGAGFGSFGRQSRLLDPTTAHANFSHSGFLQALSDGGLLLAVPFFLACAVVLAGLVRRLRPRSWRADGGAVTLLAVGSLLLTVHSAVDFDWSYPSLIAASAIFAATALAWPAETTPTPEPQQHPMVARLAVVVLVLASLVLARHAVPGGWIQNAPADPSAATALGAPVR